MTEKLLVFDIWGDFAYFRRGYTSTSTITYPFPSRTSIAGLISSILGFEKDSYHDIFNQNNSKLGLRILNPIKKMNINLNYINTKDGRFLLSDIKKNPRVQVQAEFLKDVKYRIYVSLNDKSIMDDLFSLINNHKSIYTPCLGISECLANFELVYDDLLDLNEKTGENIDINSIVLKEDYNIVIEPNRKYGVVKSPGFMNSERVVSKFLEYYYEENGNTIKIASGNYFPVGDENIILF